MCGFEKYWGPGNTKKDAKFLSVWLFARAIGSSEPELIPVSEVLSD
jgi:hypothetical protein